MSTSKKKGKNSTPEPDERDEPPPPKLLSDVPIYFWSNVEEEQSLTVPPPTPTYVTNVVSVLKPIPNEFPPLASFELPYVKEVGIKKCIEILGEFLGCTDFAFDYIQFWFLDMLTDCLWKTQDEYNLREKEQKIVLEWVMYIFKVMTNPKLSYSRKKIFTIFKEAILLAGDVITEGVADVPLPHNLFTLALEKEEDQQEDTDESTSVSTISISTSKSEEVIEMQLDGQTKEYVIGKGLGGSETSSPSESLDDTTTIATTSTKSSVDEVKLDSSIIQPEEEPVQYKDYKQFYQPDPNIPKRFLPLRAEKGERTSSTSSESDGEEEGEGQADYSEKPSYVTDSDYLARVPPIETCEKKDVENKRSLSTQATARNGSIRSQKDSSSSAQLTDSQILAKLAQYKLWEQRLVDMDDPRKGWVPIKEESLGQVKPSKAKSEDSCVDEDFDDLIRESEDFKQDNSKLISMGMLCAIIDLVFEYFYQSFHFTLIKLATQATPDTIVQALNTEWKVPKANKEELQKPKPPKKEKPKKSKERKKEKQKKSPGKSDKPPKKAKDKKGGKEKKSTKKSTKSSDKKAKKPQKLSKEEKAELERQRKLQEELEEERRKIEENKRFMFPLNDAATDELFTGIFEDWMKPVENEKKEKKGKGKGKKKK